MPKTHQTSHSRKINYIRYQQLNNQSSYFITIAIYRNNSFGYS
nr:MAG TPA: hypothetical protein [Caudoviricetes sp.]